MEANNRIFRRCRPFCVCVYVRRILLLKFPMTFLYAFHWTVVLFFPMFTDIEDKSQTKMEIPLCISFDYFSSYSFSPFIRMKWRKASYILTSHFTHRKTRKTLFFHSSLLIPHRIFHSLLVHRVDVEEIPCLRSLVGDGEGGELGRLVSPGFYAEDCMPMQ